jgi:hypothetical protein
MFIRNVCVDENEERRNGRRMGVPGWARMEDGGCVDTSGSMAERQVCEQ